jgi:hypothetical protein
MEDFYEIVAGCVKEWPGRRAYQLTPYVQLVSDEYVTKEKVKLILGKLVRVGRVKTTKTSKGEGRRYYPGKDISGLYKRLFDKVCVKVRDLITDNPSSIKDIIDDLGVQIDNPVPIHTVLSRLSGVKTITTSRTGCKKYYI